MPDAATIAAAFPACPECGANLKRQRLEGVGGALLEVEVWVCHAVADHRKGYRCWRYDAIAELHAVAVAA